MIEAFYCALTHEGVLSIEGKDSKKFLQGQLTCNLNYLSTTESSLGARCTPKGRMVSSFRIIDKAENGFLLSLDNRLLSIQLNDLKKYAIFSKVNLTDVSSIWLRFGIKATSNHQLSFLEIPLPTEINELVNKHDYFIIKIGSERYELWIHKNSTSNIVNKLAKHLPQQELTTWLLGQIQAGIGQIFLETSELFIPQMINLQAVGGVSFKKGCYTGQEIVARMQYLGKLKRHLYRFKLASEEPLPTRGSEIVSASLKTSVGIIVLAASSGNNIELLAVVQDDAITTNLWLKDRETEPLTLLNLPYTINPEKEIEY